jgi:hypothetical protein
VEYVKEKDGRKNTKKNRRKKKEKKRKKNNFKKIECLGGCWL